MSEKLDAKWRSDEVQDALADEWAETRYQADREGKLRLQIEMAAKGCVSGTGAEWPYLLIALNHWGEPAHAAQVASELREASRRVCARMGWRTF